MRKESRIKFEFVIRIHGQTWSGIGFIASNLLFADEETGSMKIDSPVLGEALRRAFLQVAAAAAAAAGLERASVFLNAKSS